MTVTRFPVFLVCAVLTLSIDLHGQGGGSGTPNRSTEPTFEVASVKANRTDTPATTLFPLGPGDAYVATGGLFRATNQPLIAYLRFAYRLGPGDLSDLPGWVYSERFDIEARAAGEPTKDQMRLLMRALLIDRFRLRAHTEQQTQPIYDLTLAEAGKMGPQLRAHRTDPCEGDPIPPEVTAPSPSSSRSTSIFQLPTLPCGSTGFMTVSAGDRTRIVGNGETMSRIADALKGPLSGIERFIRDATGLTGTFDLSLEWSRLADAVQVPSGPPDDPGPGFQEALQKQLGLRLRSTRGPVDVLVIDTIDRPTEN